MTTEHDPRTRIVLSWLHEDAHENAERVLLAALDEVDTTPQRRSWWPPRRELHMSGFAKLIAAAAAVLALAVVGSTTLPGFGIVGPGAAPVASPTLIARGSFVDHDWGRVEFEATRAGGKVTGRAAFGDGRDEGWPIHADLRCARTYEDGLVMIGGTVGDGSPQFRAGTPVWIAVRRGSLDRGMVGAGSRIDLPSTQTTDCLAYLDAWARYNRTRVGGDWIPRFKGEGTVELGP